MATLIYNDISVEDVIADDVSMYVLDRDLIQEGFLQREVIKSEPKATKVVPVFYGTKYTSVVNFKFTIIKKDKSYFTLAEVRDLNRWLTCAKLPKWFEWNECENITIYRGIVSLDSYIVEGDNTVAITYMFEADSPYSWSQEITDTFTVTTTLSDSITINSDELNDYIFPVIKIINSSGGDVEYTITNTSDNNRELSLTTVTGSIVYVDCKNLRILDELGEIPFSDIGWTDLTALKWFRLLSGDINNIDFSGNGEISFIYRYPLKEVGALI